MPTGFQLRLGAAAPGVTYSAPSKVVASAASGLSVANGWAVGGGTMSLETTNVRRPGQPVLKALANQNAADQFMTLRIQLPSVPLSGNLEFWFWLPPLSAGSRYMQLCYSSDVPSANPPDSLPSNRRRIIYASDQYPSSGWFCVQINKNGKFYSQGTPNGVSWVDTGSPNASLVNFIEIVYGCGSDVPGAERYVLTDQVAVNGKGRPCILFGFDSGSASHVSVVLPLFQARGMVAYNALDSDQIVANRDNLLPLYTAGWDIISQGGPGHINYQNNPSSLAAAISGGQAALTSEGYLTALDIFMYPNNARSAANDTVAAANGIRMGVASTQQMIPASSLGKPNFVGQSGRMPMEGVGVGFADRWRAWMDDCVESGKSMAFYSHNWVETATTETETTIGQAILALDYAVSLRDAGLATVGIAPHQYLATYS